MVNLFRNIVLTFLLLCVFACQNSDQQAHQNNFDENNLSKIEISFEVDKDVYIMTDYGEPPQIAVWLEYPDSTFYKTVWVTRRTGKNDWKGKVECPVSLPYWNRRKSNETDPGFWEKVVDAISGATVAEGLIKKSVNVKKGSEWSFYIEVNASGDYNQYFKYWSDNDIPDTEGNGQPSIIYSGKIKTDTTNHIVPIIIGRTNQLSDIDSVYSDISKITSAKSLIKNIKVKSF